ncbi:C6 finger domain protein Acr-2 [Aspergillus heteromorphus CBS 117.55]|uniref:C6 finger domain protein Acr-2 n=1 Tax=Aspergillus heteromorphus CBS 117.55 TaxID=1448321 RepID=A0A317WUQ2_9EURO|nr:C6 finger domain protein Acr-2 [Aspergillus heteromorphus CBS 117.55]PWY90153.1 C6 finger domain protein Acr-2 [Aspergillus heteromorphus CBS 117.55]
MSKGCYTCRRRRIICDNGLPTCRKCRDAGKECLGYQKPLVWVKGGVASRGKMMGRSFDDVKGSPSYRGPDDSSSSPSNTSPPSADSPRHIGPELPTDPSWRAAPNNVSTVLGVSETTPWEDDDTQLALQRATSTVPAPWGLVDPLFRDLNQMSRFYIVHFNQNLANYLTLYSEARNPFRDLIPLVGDSPLLSHVLAATGALHYAILANGDFSLAPWISDGPSATDPVLSPEEVERAVIGSMSQRPPSKVYEHFLGLKQRALQQLSQDIQDPVLRNDNRTLAAIMVLALMDAIESGDGAWKYHLEGAKKLLKGRQEQGTPRHSVVKWLEDFAVDGILLIQLMGSTLARPGALTQPFYTCAMGPAVLKRLEETSWVGCPAYLLEVIFLIHAGLYFDSSLDPSTQQPSMTFSSAFLSKDTNPLQNPGALLQHIQAFDPAAWSESMQSCFHLADLSMRTALATVYKAAVYLYASRVLSRPRSGAATIPNHFGLPSDHAAVAHLIIQQIALIPIADPHFKCLIWPTFIAGAECTDPAQRPFLLDKLRALYYDITSVNVRNAAWVLSLMWRKQDQKREEQDLRRNMAAAAAATAVNNDNDDEDDEDDDFDWIQVLDESRIDWLFI